MKRIDELYAFVSDDGDDGEGIVAFVPPGSSTWMPLVGADAARVDSLRRAAQAIATASGRPVRLLRFRVREELEVIAPQTKAENDLKKAPH